MNWLLGKITGNPMVIAYVAGICFVAGMATAGVPIWKYQGALRDKVQAEFDSFKAQVKANGDAAQKIADAKDAENKRAKENADERQKELEARNTDLSMRLLNSRRTSGSYVPKAATGSSHPDRICFNRAKLDGAIRHLDEGISGLVKTGDDFRIGLDTGKVWAKSIK